MKSISLDRDFENGADDPPITDGLSHELPSSSSDSAFEIAWKSFLCKDDTEQGPGGPEDEPWYPCDPENSLDAEMEGVVVTSQLEEQIKICYGMVSRFFFSLLFLLQ
jgi:hypothetical protein